jgi:hypothetical protein
MAAAGKRIGRPIKPALPGERPSLGLKVTAATKALIEALARTSGRTQSAQAEYLIERCLLYDRLVLAARVTEHELAAAQARSMRLTECERASAASVRREPSPEAS